MSKQILEFANNEFGLELDVTAGSGADVNVTVVCDYITAVLNDNDTFAQFMSVFKNWKEYEGYAQAQNKSAIVNFKTCLRWFAESTTSVHNRKLITITFESVCDAGYKIKNESGKRRAWDF
jgi:hypothetical protein